MFDINEFRANIDKQGTFNSSHFEVLITHPGLDLKETRYRCQGIELPGRTLQTLELKTAGPPRKIAYDSIFTEVTANIICSKNLEEKELFENWQNKAVGEYRNLQSNNQDMFSLGFFDDYIGTVTIFVYDATKKLERQYVLEEAYPINVSSLQLSWTNNEVTILPVTFTYTHLRKVK